MGKIIVGMLIGAILESGLHIPAQDIDRGNASRFDQQDSIQIDAAPPPRTAILPEPSESPCP